MKEEFLRSMREMTKDAVLVNEPMAKHTTFAIGGPADCFVMPENEQELLDVLSLCREEKVPVRVLGRGSNVLVSDSGYQGVIVSTERMKTIIRNGNTLTAQAGVLLSSLAASALQAGLSGLEFASGIPGTVGGAVVMNAGAYGSEMKDVLLSVEVADKEGRKKTVSAEDLSLGYRTSCIEEEEWIVLSAKVSLSPGDPEKIRETMQELNSRRREKQPLEYPSAGSTFKRPEGYYAGKLIEEAGLAGYTVGGAAVSEKHCGFVINKDKATAEDVRKLIGTIKDRVRKNSGVELSPEIRMIGDFSSD